MKPIFTTVVVLFCVVVFCPCHAAGGCETFSGAQGRYQDSATTDSSGRTTYRDAQGRTVGTKK